LGYFGFAANFDLFKIEASNLNEKVYLKELYNFDVGFKF
jgi:hypothetical protein